MTAKKPCPFCGNRELVVFCRNCRDYNVHCGNCGLRGPNAPAREKAIQAWNSLPREKNGK